MSLGRLICPLALSMIISSGVSAQYYPVTLHNNGKAVKNATLDFVNANDGSRVLLVNPEKMTIELESVDGPSLANSIQLRVEGLTSDQRQMLFYIKPALLVHYRKWAGSIQTTIEQARREKQNIVLYLNTDQKIMGFQGTGFKNALMVNTVVTENEYKRKLLMRSLQRQLDELAQGYGKLDVVLPEFYNDLGGLSWAPVVEPGLRAPMTIEMKPGLVKAYRPEE